MHVILIVYHRKLFFCDDIIHITFNNYCKIYFIALFYLYYFIVRITLKTKKYFILSMSLSDQYLIGNCRIVKLYYISCVFGSILYLVPFVIKHRFYFGMKEEKKKARPHRGTYLAMHNS